MVYKWCQRNAYKGLVQMIDTKAAGLTYNDFLGGKVKPMLSRQTYADCDKAYDVANRQGLKADGVGFSSKKKIAIVHKASDGTAVLTIYPR